MQRPYVAHLMEGRARLRHPALADAGARETARVLLLDEAGVCEVRPGKESLLLLMDSGTDFAAICLRLEEKMPGLLTPRAEAAAARRTERRARFAAAQDEGRGRRKESRGCGDMLGDVRLPGFLQVLGKGNGKTRIMGVSPRKFEVRTMLGAGSLCLLSGLAGGKALHVAAGLAWAALATRHVWVRRKAL